jgi:hypothetical protein
VYANTEDAVVPYLTRRPLSSISRATEDQALGIVASKVGLLRSVV